MGLHQPTRLLQPVAADTSRAWRTGWIALFLAAAWLLAAHTVADPDLWGHLLFGRQILTEGRLPATDPYSYTSGQTPWINHEILSETTFAWTYDRWHATGLILLKLVLVMLTLTHVFCHAVRRGLPSWPAGLLVILVSVLMLADTITIRPHLFTYLFFTWTVLLLLAAQRCGHRWLLPLPPLMALWINTHGGVLAGVALVWAWVAAHCLRKPASGSWRPRVTMAGQLPLLGIAVACTLALLCNPYGLRLITFLVATATVPRPEITEWNPLPMASLEGAGYLGLVAVVVAAVWTERRSLPPGSIAILACTGLLPLLAQRHLPLFAVAWALAGAESLGAAWRRRTASGEPSTETVMRWMIPVPWLVALTLVVISLPRLTKIPVDRDRFPMPTRAVQLIQDSRAEGNLALLFDWGEYAIWHLQPRVKVSIDGRRETVYSHEAYQRNRAFMWGTDQWDSLLNESPTDMALMPQHGPTVNLLRRHRQWTLVYEDDLCCLFARRGSEQAALLSRTTPPLTTASDSL